MNSNSIKRSITNFLKGESEIVFAYLFGSFVEEDSYNDIDIGIFVKSNDYKKIVASKTNYDILLVLEIEKISKTSYRYNYYEQCARSSYL